MTVLVTGATGTVHIVHHLLRAGQKVRALTRNPATAANRTATGRVHRP
jgi:uncharacterized protein YbjT (DUF2867 family)